MEVSGVVLRQAPCFSSTGVDAFNSRHLSSFPTKKPFCIKHKTNLKSLVASASFDDKSHLQYYNGPKMAVLKEKEVASKKKDVKKKLKLLKGLSKNLSTFSDMGFGLNPDDDGLDQQVKGQMISEATEVLLGQLQKLKTEEMEYKKMKKEEKVKKKAAKMMMVCDDSSSDSSSSSESDCENVVDMKQLKTVSTTPKAVVVLEEVTPSLRVVPEIPISNPGNVSVSVDEGSKKIEVCMGGKCKKSGAEMLMENFQKAVGGEAAAAVAVVGCKCMGKCKEAPNVKVRTGNGDPLFIGVGIEDVDSIVANFFGGNQRCGSDMIPAMSSI